jgi:ribose 5-phosphate isomerase A
MFMHPSSDDTTAREAAARAVLAEIHDVRILGVGTGRAVAAVLALLDPRRLDIKGAVPSSEATRKLLLERGWSIVDPNTAGDLELYVDGADEFDTDGRLIKGGGGALVREKILASAARRFVVVAEERKKVPLLGRFPIPVEVLPPARSLVARRLVALGGAPTLREGFVSDNGNPILDVTGLPRTDPVGLERTIKLWPGVVDVGLCTLRRADRIYAGRPDGSVERIDPSGG